jgi:hypothetical protein
MPAGQAIRNAATSTVPQFSQTAFVFGVLAFMFLLFVTIKGDLPKWIGLLLRSGTASPSTGQTASTGFSAPGTNSAGSAVPDILSGNHDDALPQLGNFAGGAVPDSISGNHGDTATGTGPAPLIPNYDSSGQWIGYTRP